MPTPCPPEENWGIREASRRNSEEMRRSVQRLQCTVSLWLEYDALDICNAFGVFSETQFVIIHWVFYL